MTVMAAHSHSVLSQRHDEVMSFDANVIPQCEFYCKTINQKEVGQKMAICYMKYKLERSLRLVQPSRLTST